MVPVMRLYDTRRGSVVPFEPGPLVSMYVCGITPYDATHLGHAVTYVTYDVLQRRLIDLGHEVRYVRNITDVDDDLLAAAHRRGVHYLDLAFGETAQFDDDMRALNTLEPWSEPRATGAIPNIRGVVNALLSTGHAYLVGGSGSPTTVFFDTAASDRFGTLSALGDQRMLDLTAGADDFPNDPRKRNPLDFVVWRPSAAGEPEWEARWGPGRPGWHVECAALALRELGDTIDLHGGGVDLLFPHHECVAAQAEAITGKPFVRHWLHQSMVHVDGRKMAKSTGNLVMVRDLRRLYPAAAIRIALSMHHYRRPWSWSGALLDDAMTRYRAWVQAGEGEGAIDEVRRYVDDDLDVPGALNAIGRAVERGEGVSQTAALLGIHVPVGP